MTQLDTSRIWPKSKSKPSTPQDEKQTLVIKFREAIEGKTIPEEVEKAGLVIINNIIITIIMIISSVWISIFSVTIIIVIIIIIISVYYYYY